MRDCAAELRDAAGVRAEEGRNKIAITFPMKLVRQTCLVLILLPLIVLGTAALVWESKGPHDRHGECA